MPKFIQDDEIFVNIKATKEFTDREEPRKVFWNTYDKMKSEINPNIHVISYYGFGGIGKSALLNKLNEEVKKKASESKVEFLDLDKLLDASNNILDVLKIIRQDLKEKYNFSFPIFDLVVYVYETKLGKTATKPELNSIFDENKELGFLKDFITEIPLIGTFAKVIYYADVGKNLLKERLNNNKLRNRLEEIESLSPEDIKQYLAYYFSIDLKENLKNEKSPFVFFIDTYEKLVNELNQVGDVLKNDLWLRSDEGLICRIPNVLWVIAGREKLKWEDIDESWKGTLDQHLLGTLSFQDTQHFLNLAGIDNDELIHELYNLTHGTPIYLDMCVDTYVKLKEKGKNPVIEDFGEDTTALIKRFFMYMNDAERDFTTMLAFIGEWNDENIVDISKKMLGSFSASLYSKIKDFSFITIENGSYRIIDTVRDITIANANKIERQRYTENYRNDIEDKVQEIKKILEDTNKIAQEVKNTQIKNEEKIENLKKIQMENNINEKALDIEYRSKSKLDNYKCEEEYLKIILKMIKDLLYISTEELFIERASHLLEKIEEYEYKFNKVFVSENLKQVLNKFSSYKEDAIYIKLQIKYEINYNIKSGWKNYLYTFKDGKNIIIDAYEKLSRIFGEGNKEILYPIYDLVSKVHISELYNAKDSIIPALISILEKYNLQDSIYYIKLLSCVNKIEFIKKMEYYKPEKIDTLYIEVLCYSNNEMYTYYDDFGGEDEGSRYVSKSVKSLIDILSNNPNLLNSTIVRELIKIPSICSYFETQEMNLFNYIASIRKEIIDTTNIELIDSYYKLLLKYEHGFGSYIYDNSYKEAREKVRGLLIELYERYSEIFGKDSDIVINIKASLLKLNITMNDNQNIFDEIEQSIQKLGINDERNLIIATKVFDGLKELNEEYKLKKSISTEQRYDNFKNMIDYTNRFLDSYYEKINDVSYIDKFKVFIINIQKVLQSYQSYFYYSKEASEFEKYNKTIIDMYIRIDKLMPNDKDILNNFLYYCTLSLTRGYLDYSKESFNKEYELEGIKYLISRLENYNNMEIPYYYSEFILSYMAYKIFEIKKKLMSKYYLIDLNNLINSSSILSKISMLESEYDSINDKNEKIKSLSQLVLFKLINDPSQYTYISKILNIYMKKDSFVTESKKNIEISCSFSANSELIYYLKNMQKLNIYQKELTQLCNKYYDKKDNITLYEEMILTLIKASFPESGVKDLIASIEKRAKDQVILEELNEISKVTNILDNLRKRIYGEKYMKFNDLSNINFIN